MKKILDVTCSGRMMWFDKNNPNALFTDIREVDTFLCNDRFFSVKPDQKEDVTHLSFQDKTFKLVIFDPPHLKWVGDKSWLYQKYGRLPDPWPKFINESVHECMRVLDDYGVLIFKWNETQIKVSSIIDSITDYKPLFGHPTRKNGTTIWMCFMKLPF